MNITDLIEREHGTRNWVLARRTKAIVERYGEDVVTLSAKQLRELELQLEYTMAPDHPMCALIEKLIAEQYPAAGFIRALRAEGYRIEKVYETRPRAR